MKIKTQQLNDVQKAIVINALKKYAQEEEGRKPTNDGGEELIAMAKAMAIAVEHGVVIISSFLYESYTE